MKKEQLQIFAVALVVRLVALAVFPDLPLPTDTVVGYEPYAQNLLRGNGYVSDDGARATRAPLYPFLLAGSHFFFGESFLPVKTTQAILDATTAAIILVIASTVFGARIGFWAGMTSALYPLQIYFALTVSTETLYAFLLSGSMLSFILGITKGSIRYTGLSAILFGLCALCRPVILGYPFLAALALLLSKPVQNRLLHAVLLVGAFLLVVTPWIVRNYEIFHTFVPIATEGGVSLAQGSSIRYMVPTEEKVKMGDIDFQRFGIDRSKWKNEVERDAGHRELAFRNTEEMLINRPFDMVLLFGYKFIRLWYATDSGRNELPIILVQSPIFLFALLGIRNIMKEKLNVSLFLILLLLGFSVGLHTIMSPLVRYAVPIMPFVIMIALRGFLKS